MRASTPAARWAAPSCALARTFQAQQAPEIASNEIDKTINYGTNNKLNCL